MKKNYPISFDFDSTLSRTVIQEYAEQLIKDGYDVWITTTRLSNERYLELNTLLSETDWNDDLFEVSDRLGISRDKIRFTNGGDKWKWFKHQYFVWHLDDDWYDLKGIQRHTKTTPISCFGNSTWKNKCEKLLK